MVKLITYEVDDRRNDENYAGGTLQKPKENVICYASVKRYVQLNFRIYVNFNHESNDDFIILLLIHPFLMTVMTLLLDRRLRVNPSILL